MNATSIKEIQQVKSLYDRFYLNKTITNCYLTNEYLESQIEKEALFYTTTENNLFLYVRKIECYHLFYFINCFDELVNVGMDLPVSMEIIYRGEKNFPDKIVNFWQLNGFQKHLIRDNLIANYSNIPLMKHESKDVLISLANESDASVLHDIYAASFDIYTGDMLSLQEIKDKIQSEQIICAYHDDKFCGFLEFELKNNNVWLNHVAVSENFRGMGISNLLIAAYVNLNKINETTKYQLWVIQDNIAAVNLYKKFGFVYNNKSTISMLKQN
jgi:GNAT superfamily N-acetyltransferase